MIMIIFFFFFFNDTATTYIYTGCYTLSLHDALPIYCALYRNAATIEFFVVIAHAVVHIDERRGDVSVGGVSVIRGKLFGLLIRSGILRHRGLLQLCHKFRGRD